MKCARIRINAIFFPTEAQSLNAFRDHVAQFLHFCKRENSAAWEAQ